PGQACGNHFVSVLTITNRQVSRRRDYLDPVAAFRALAIRSTRPDPHAVPDRLAHGPRARAPAHRRTRHAGHRPQRRLQLALRVRGCLPRAPPGQPLTPRTPDTCPMQVSRGSWVNTTHDWSGAVDLD